MGEVERLDSEKIGRGVWEMMTWIISFLILLSVVTAAVNGNMGQASSAILDSGREAVNLLLTLTGSLCFWSGLLRVADRAGLTSRLAAVLYPVTRRLFGFGRGKSCALSQESPALRAISVNLAANLLGLGNAATPAGIQAVRELQKLSPQPQTATNHMVLFVVLNTASLQLVPTTTAMLRLSAGSTAPMEILPAVWISSVLSVSVGVMAARLLGALWPQPGTSPHPLRLGRPRQHPTVQGGKRP